MVSKRVNYSNTSDEEEERNVFSHLALPELPTLHDDLEDPPPLSGSLSLLTPRAPMYASTIADCPMQDRTHFGLETSIETLPMISGPQFLDHPTDNHVSFFYDETRSYNNEQQGSETTMGECVDVHAWNQHNENSANPFLVRHCHEILSSFLATEQDEPMNQIESMEDFLQGVIDICNDANAASSRNLSLSSEERGDSSSVWKLQ